MAEPSLPVSSSPRLFRRSTVPPVRASLLLAAGTFMPCRGACEQTASVLRVAVLEDAEGSCCHTTGTRGE